MLWLLAIVPALPLLGFGALLFAGGVLGRRGVAWVGAGSVGLSAVVALVVTTSFLASPPAGDAYHQVLWTWWSVAGLRPQVAFTLDAVSVVWMLVITFVGFLIHLYSTGHMARDESYRRFFVYMNLFVFSMLVLVLADNLVLLFLGWEGVGLCSYLLIAFWHKDLQNVYSGRKAFIVTRVGDTAFIVGLFLLFAKGHTLAIQPLMATVGVWGGGGVAAAAALLLLGGAVGKSAQLPLQTWLPDAMAGPSPVSALIHAATMVTAGVYLIVRTHALYTAAPDVRLTVAIVGAATLLYAGLSALNQRDIKRVLAYSTISQIGYMFLALGVGAWTAAVFLFMCHAFFKALLFLSAGVIIEAQDDEHDIFRMGGLRRALPVAFWSFLIGAAALAALPLITSGFYAKDLVLEETLASVDGSVWLWAAGVAGSLVTAVYIFRVVFVVFWGPLRIPVGHRPSSAEKLPLYLLSGLSLVAGLLALPRTWSAWQPFAGFLTTSVPETVTKGLTSATWLTTAVETAVTLVGLLAAWWVYLRRAAREGWALAPSTSRAALFLYRGWDFDRLYDTVFVAPARWFAHVSRNDLVEPVVGGIAALAKAANHGLSLTQNGRVRSYALVIGIGVAAGALVVLLR
jgi:NADH-quinone oxidoreductase subunit L